MSPEDQAITAVTAESHEAHPPKGFIAPDVQLGIFTWITFFLLLVILRKYAWNPILSGLEAREKHIRDAVGNADKLKEELARLDAMKDKIITEAENKSKEIIAQSRKAAQEAARHVEHKAREEAQIVLENARRDIKEEVEKAQANLREESATLAIKLAGKIIEENLDTEKNRKLINNIIKEM